MLTHMFKSEKTPIFNKSLESSISRLKSTEVQLDSIKKQIEKQNETSITKIEEIDIFKQLLKIHADMGAEQLHKFLTETGFTLGIIKVACSTLSDTLECDSLDLWTDTIKKYIDVIIKIYETELYRILVPKDQTDDMFYFVLRQCNEINKNFFNMYFGDAKFLVRGFNYGYLKGMEMICREYNKSIECEKTPTAEEDEDKSIKFNEPPTTEEMIWRNFRFFFVNKAYCTSEHFRIDQSIFLPPSNISVPMDNLSNISVSAGFPQQKFFKDFNSNLYEKLKSRPKDEFQKFMINL